ncbi:MAG: hypothetical protein IKC79_00655, partial [Clostridia bacterium]|nr:hypothetical protein [Clostridia bacterium]
MKLREILDNAGFTKEYLRLDNAQYSRSEDICSLLFVYPDGADFTELQQLAVTQAIAPVFDNLCNYECKFHRSTYDKEVFVAVIKDYLFHEYRALSNYFTPDTLSFLKKGNIITITMRCDEMTANIIQTQGFATSLTRMFPILFNLDIKNTFAPKPSIIYQIVLSIAHPRRSEHLCH